MRKLGACRQMQSRPPPPNEGVVKEGGGEEMLSTSGTNSKFIFQFPSNSVCSVPPPQEMR